MQASGIPEVGVIRYDGMTGALLNWFIAPGAGLLEPCDLVFHGRTCLVGDSQAGILRFNADTGAFGGVFVPLGSGGLNSPQGLAICPDGHLYVSSTATHSVLRYDGTSGAWLDTFVPAGGGGLRSPAGLAFGTDGDLYVCSSGHRAVLGYDGRTGQFTKAVVPFWDATFSSGPQHILQFPSAPKMTVATWGKNVRVSWPSAWTNVLLESSPRIPAAAPSYSPVNGTPILVGPQWMITNGITGGAEFYRLRVTGQ
jgi:hypothetical protein